MFEHRRLRKNGMPGDAAVRNVCPRPKITAGGQRKYDFIVDVTGPHGSPFRAELMASFYALGPIPREGEVVRVLYDASTHDVMFVLEGDPRDDIDALEAQQRATRDLLRQDVDGRPTTGAIAQVGERA